MIFTLSSTVIKNDFEKFIYQKAILKISYKYDMKKKTFFKVIVKNRYVTVVFKDVFSSSKKLCAARKMFSKKIKNLKKLSSFLIFTTTTFC